MLTKSNQMEDSKMDDELAAEDASTETPELASPPFEPLDDNSQENISDFSSDARSDDAGSSDAVIKEMPMSGAEQSESKSETESQLENAPETPEEKLQEPPPDPDKLDESVTQPETEKTDADEATQVEEKEVVNRELKLLLALSKEAKLSTNLSSKRKSLEPVAKKSESIPKKPKGFPVTAESELEEPEVASSTASEETARSKSTTPSTSKKKAASSLAETDTEGATDSPAKKNPGVHGLTGKIVMFKPNKDAFCWRCHHDSVDVACETCPRSYHQKCLKYEVTDLDHWPCPECVSILKAESTQTRSKAMEGMTLEHLCSLLKFAVKRMIQCNGSEPFVNPVDETQFPEYRNYIIQPMNLTMLEQNIKDNLYGSTQAFEADAKWILHNSIIFNSVFSDSTGQSRLTNVAKTILKICKQEMAEIENCSSCYRNANTKKHTWFVEVCPKPHLLVWAKLKGFPYWPAKVMTVSHTGMVDVRFFGAHDKAWISVKECYMYSSKDPNSGKNKRNDIMECVRELEVYVDNLRAAYGRVNYAPFKTPLKYGDEQKLLQQFLPTYKDGKFKNQDQGIDKIVEAKAEGKEVPRLSFFDDESNDSKTSKDSSDVVKEPPLKLRIDYSTPAKPKITQKLIKSEQIRKRRNTDNAVPSSKSKMQRRSEQLPKSASESTLDDGGSGSTKLEKVKISDQLMKKLSDDKGGSKSDGKDDSEKGDKIDENTDEKSDEKIDKKSDEKSDEKSDKKPVTEAEKKEEKVSDLKEPEICTTDEEKKSEASSSSTKDKSSSDDERPEKTPAVNKTSIINIIHSSLNKSKPGVSVLKKRKASDEGELFSPHKMVKLVPIENILRKSTDITSTTSTATVSTPSRTGEEFMVLKKVRLMKEGKEVKEKQVTPQPIVIKDEVASDEDNDDRYMERKRQLFSALNISEKSDAPNTTPKSHEIRTRSKTEEKKSKALVQSSSGTNSPSNTPASSSASSSASKERSKEIYIKPLSKMQTPKHKARKSFPTPNYSKKNASATPQKILPAPPPTGEIRVVATSTLQPIHSGSSLIIMPPKLHYTKPPPLVPSEPIITLIPKPTNAVTSEEGSCSSQNYIPQGEPNNSGLNNGSLLNNLLSNANALLPLPSLSPVCGTTTVTTATARTTGDSLSDESAQAIRELDVLTGILPENVSKGVNEILCKPPPRLKPKPFGALSAVVCEPSVPSVAGPASSRINTVAQKLGDYFRGLLVETVTDLGKSDNAEATISSMKLEIEELKYRHAIELAEIRRNVSIVLKDIQKSVVEERERIVSDVKAKCEAETAKKVEEAKSKQWCANCMKEAQFYCCWNTSYCDYPCQQKHWTSHMSKCTQNTNQNPTTTAAAVRSPGQQVVLTPTAAPKFGTLFAKPQKVYLKRTNAPFKQTPGGHITLIESTPGNFELLGGGGAISMNGKIITSTTVLEKIKTGNMVTVASPSGGSKTEPTNAQSPKVLIASKSPMAVSKSGSSEH